MNTAPVGDSGVIQGFYSGFGNGRGFRHGSSSSSPPVLLDGEMEEFDADIMEMAKKKKGVGGGGRRDEKTAMALKSHSEAERRRRERINAHLATLRSMIPCTEKLEKAALLAEVISHVKELKSNAAEISKDLAVPSDTDEVRVEAEDHGGSTNSRSFFIKASLSCEDCADLFIDVKQALQHLKLKIVGAEVTTLGGRVKFTFVMWCDGAMNDADKHVYTTTVHQAFKSVLESVNSTVEFMPRASLLNKRRRISPFESSSSSS